MIAGLDYSPERNLKRSSMYQYNDNDQTLVDERVAQFRRQTEQFLKGEISEDQYRALRLRNGLYIQTHAPMLRIAGPYGLLNSMTTAKIGPYCSSI